MHIAARSVNETNQRDDWRDTLNTSGSSLSCLRHRIFGYLTGHNDSAVMLGTNHDETSGAATTKRRCDRDGSHGPSH